jgi:hypothetical protein
MERAWVFESSATVDEFTRPYTRALIIRGWNLKTGRVPTFIAARGLSTIVFRIDYDARGILVRARVKTLFGGGKTAEADLVWAGQSAQLTIQTQDAERRAPALLRPGAAPGSAREAGTPQGTSTDGTNERPGARRERGP